MRTRSFGAEFTLTSPTSYLGIRLVCEYETRYEPQLTVDTQIT